MLRAGSLGGEQSDCQRVWASPGGNEHMLKSIVGVIAHSVRIGEPLSCMVTGLLIYLHKVVFKNLKQDKSGT